MNANNNDFIYTTDIKNSSRINELFLRCVKYEEKYNYYKSKYDELSKEVNVLKEQINTFLEKRHNPFEEECVSNPIILTNTTSNSTLVIHRGEDANADAKVLEVLEVVEEEEEEEEEVLEPEENEELEPALDISDDEYNKECEVRQEYDFTKKYGFGYISRY